jgi:hypothetical protein
LIVKFEKNQGIKAMEPGLTFFGRVYESLFVLGVVLRRYGHPNEA